MSNKKLSNEAQTPPLRKGVVGCSSFQINPREWNLFQWCYAYVLWALFWCGLINLIMWAFS
jgi:hypothetical protein